MKKILITGGAGFIGSGLAEKLVENPENFVITLDNLSTGSLNKLPRSKYKNHRFVQIDTKKYEELAPFLLTNFFDYVFHYAAVVGVRRTLENPIDVLGDIEGIKNILKLCKITRVKRFFYASSSEVYGEPVEIPQKESSPLNTRLPYAAVKNIGECLCRSYNQEFGLDYTIFRFFNTYGSKQSKDFVMSRFIAQALNNENLTIYGDGSQTRTFCYIKDNTDATANALYKDVFVNEVVNIGSDQEVSVKDLAKKVIELTNSKSKIVFKPRRKVGDMQRRRPEISKMRKLLSRELTPLEKGMGKTAVLLGSSDNKKFIRTISPTF
jgi:UDP-glucose 4-epimerase